MRQVELGEQHRQALALWRLRIEQQHAASPGVPAAHVDNDEEARVRHLHDSARKDQPVLLAGDEACAIAGAHRDRKFGK